MSNCPQFYNNLVLGLESYTRSGHRMAAEITV